MKNDNQKIVSVSRRTDIPAFYGDWFMNRLEEGWAGYVNPFGGQKYVISLKPEDVVCFVFWSKNYIPFLDKIDAIHEMGYSFYFNYTITGLPNLFETHTIDEKSAVESVKEISRRYSPKHINWRYDPILISDITDTEYHLRTFDRLTAALEGYVERCFISYVDFYGKVIKNIEKLKNHHRIQVFSPQEHARIALARQLADIAGNRGMTIYACCEDDLVASKIHKARCIDREVIQTLFDPTDYRFSNRPTRKGCGCTASVDIGAYDSCPHGCVYCYANVNKEKARYYFEHHDPASPFLGYPKKTADIWIKEIQNTDKKSENTQQRQLPLFHKQS